MAQRRVKRRGQFSGKTPRRPQIHRGHSSHYDRYGRPKVSHFTEEEARESAERTGMHGVVVYRCRTCLMFHKARPKARRE